MSAGSHKMMFGKKLETEIYSPWASHYIAYDTLKKLLRENVITTGNDGEQWSEAHESRFVSALDHELEKVYAFEKETYNSLMERADKLDAQSQSDPHSIDLSKFEAELDDITHFAQELNKFSRINFAAFYKIAKKHNKIHPEYTVNALLKVRMASLPFHNEDYSPLLTKLSSLYSFLRTTTAGAKGNSALSSTLPTSLSASQPVETAIGSPTVSAVGSAPALYTSYRFWVHPDNLLEVKTAILRHLPLLVYNPQVAKAPFSSVSDPLITMLYFDSPDFHTYENRLAQKLDSAVRIRWHGNLNDNDSIIIEKKNVEGDRVTEERVSLKLKYVNDFLGNNVHMERQLHKMHEKHLPDSDIARFESSVNSIKSSIDNNDLQPVLRAVFTRTAFQIPGDDSLRISLDSNILFIREDSFGDRPSRDPSEWHRTDIDDSGIEYPYPTIKKYEKAAFPYSVLELKVVNDAETGAPGQLPNWMRDLADSGLVKEIPRFSKYVQGVASLFEDDGHVSTLPYWLTEIDADNERPMPPGSSKPLGPAIDATAGEQGNSSSDEDEFNETIRRLETVQGMQEGRTSLSRSLGNGFSNRRRAFAGADPDAYVGEDDEDSDDNEEYSDDDDDEDDGPTLPPGVRRPTTWLSQSGPVKVEAKVWLANERTFNKWMHIMVLLAGVSFAMGKTPQAYMFFAASIFSGLWGYGVFTRRLDLIRARDGRHLDEPFGPILVSIFMLVALISQFATAYGKYRDVLNTTFYL
ncbi:hypothetical protein CANCADRAFT_31215 [Tortispora caseinolytica NRRL Y-17796]|uniref:SPX domain-containing protein n=1 Tax=Tortispora caseinolytica NRRL Y-17796 TaxID=767744 RepID=A0A1E4TEQ0_9ASCO|nr:hypothetical protein CANCADRAFT_31215 [Tortispora caseinolytica NRRL Y-17796]